MWSMSDPGFAALGRCHPCLVFASSDAASVRSCFFFSRKNKEHLDPTARLQALRTKTRSGARWSITTAQAQNDRGV